MVASAQAREVVVGGEVLQARADRTLYWPAAETLFVADVHLGKVETFRALGVPVPGRATEESLTRLSLALQESKAKRLIILGDLWHAQAGRTAGALETLFDWRRQFSEVEMTLVEGNHDRRAGILPLDLNIAEIQEGSRLGPFSLCHDPAYPAEPYILAGHIHPGVALQGRARQSLRLPCFWFGETIGVLPAFGEFTGYAAVKPCVGDQVFAVAENQIWSSAEVEKPSDC